MSDHSPLDHARLQDALWRADAEMGAAEAHGLLCALQCSPHPPEESQWMDEILGDGAAGDLLREECRDALRECREQVRREMLSPSLGLRLLLPPDEEPLGRRSEALGEWCSAFLYGLGLAGIGQGLGDEVDELLGDLSQIARVQATPGGGAEERAFMELVEYVRMGVLLVREEAHGRHAGAGEERH